MTTAIFIHDEMLNAELPVFQAHPEMMRIFVFDDRFLKAEGWTVKRIQFVADGLLEIPGVRVFKGSAKEIIHSLGIQNLITQATPNANICGMIDGISGVKVTYVPEPEFVSYSGSLARFTRFWNGVEKQLMR